MKELSEALISEGQTDIMSAELLYKGEIYARAIFHCHQALEKIAKAILHEEGY